MATICTSSATGPVTNVVRSVGRSPAGCEALAWDGGPNLRHPHLRVPDERARFRADRRAARGRRVRARLRPGGRRRHGAQHLLHPRERRQQAVRRPGPAQGGEGPATRRAHRGGRVPRPEGSGAGPGAGRPRRRGVRHPQRASGRGTHRPRPPSRAGGGDPHRDGPRGRRGVPVGPACAAGSGALRLGDDPDRMRQQLHVLHRARSARPRDQPPLRRTGRRGAGSGRGRRQRGHPAGPERQQLRP